MKKVGVFVYNSSPMLGRALFTPIIFGWCKEDKYVKKINDDLEKKRINCNVILDPSESNIEELKRISDFIICTPGLQKQFYLGEYDKRNVIYLTTLEYSCNDTDRVIRFIDLLK
ncbi:Uncharacterised protein [Yersinia frederiksenii]|uniref:hypothetical protein n=1 Tax=Yersinia frederiksenii TaxID=29484 RepID=UPI0005E1464B|nr:hypothetical protein [Yersinia frederiksenii]CNC93564.1 Uncharacterised protein [Yersinia frederiksenii]